LKSELSQKNKAVGLRQSIKAFKKGNVIKAYIAKDVKPEVINEFMQLCENGKVEIIYVESQIRLGELCNIERPATVACIIEK